MGRLVVLPFENGFGENNALEAQFREDGSLASVRYDRKASRGEGVTKAVNGGLDQALAFDTALRAKREADLKKAEDSRTHALDLQIAELKKQKELLELEAAMSDASVARQNRIAELNAQIAELTAEKTLRDLQIQTKT
jgi:hypothetical protein